MKPTTKKAAKATKKASAKAPIIKRIKSDCEWLGWFEEVLAGHFGKRELTELCRKRGVPIKKGKPAIVEALACHLAAEQREVTITIR